jgi:hypothetical protein
MVTNPFFALFPANRCLTLAPATGCLTRFHRGKTPQRDPPSGKFPDTGCLQTQNPRDHTTSVLLTNRGISGHEMVTKPGFSRRPDNGCLPNRPSDDYILRNCDWKHDLAIWPTYASKFLLVKTNRFPWSQGKFLAKTCFQQWPNVGHSCRN